jgi:hypothetical protein
MQVQAVFRQLLGREPSSNDGQSNVEHLEDGTALQASFYYLLICAVYVV